jgi:hypothetical protein
MKSWGTPWSQSHVTPGQTLSPRATRARADGHPGEDRREGDTGYPVAGGGLTLPLRCLPLSAERARARPEPTALPVQPQPDPAEGASTAQAHRVPPQPGRGSGSRGRSSRMASRGPPSSRSRRRGSWASLIVTQDAQEARELGGTRADDLRPDHLGLAPAEVGPERDVHSRLEGVERAQVHEWPVVALSDRRPM